MHVKTLYIATFFQPIEIGLSTVQMYRIIVKRVANLFGLPGFSGRPEQLKRARERRRRGQFGLRVANRYDDCRRAGWESL